jgi:hypothetical protein
LAIIRTDKLIGRATRLQISIKTKTGAKTIGEPAGVKCDVKNNELKLKPKIKRESQIVKAPTSITVIPLKGKLKGTNDHTLKNTKILKIFKNLEVLAKFKLLKLLLKLKVKISIIKSKVNKII